MTGSRNRKDSAYLRAIEGERIVVRTEFSQINTSSGQNRVWKHYAATPRYRDHLFVKLDDDVVFLNTDSFGSFIQALLDNPECIVSALTVNNGASTRLIPELWARYERIGIRLLDVHLSAEYAEMCHRWFFDNWHTLTIRTSEVIPTADWVSINAIALTWPVLRQLASTLRARAPREIAGRFYTPRDRIGDEGAANLLPRQIYTGFGVAHLTFGPQDKRMSVELVAELRGHYAHIAEQYLDAGCKISA